MTNFIFLNSVEDEWVLESEARRTQTVSIRKLSSSVLDTVEKSLFSTQRSSTRNRRKQGKVTWWLPTAILGTQLDACATVGTNELWWWGQNIDNHFKRIKVYQLPLPTLLGTIHLLIKLDTYLCAKFNWIMQ